MGLVGPRVGAQIACPCTSTASDSPTRAVVSPKFWADQAEVSISTFICLTCEQFAQPGHHPTGGSSEMQLRCRLSNLSRFTAEADHGILSKFKLSACGVSCFTNLRLLSPHCFILHFFPGYATDENLANKSLKDTITTELMAAEDETIPETADTKTEYKFTSPHLKPKNFCLALHVPIVSTRWVCRQKSSYRAWTPSSLTTSNSNKEGYILLR